MQILPYSTIYHHTMCKLDWMQGRFSVRYRLPLCTFVSRWQFTSSDVGDAISATNLVTRIDRKSAKLKGNNKWSEKGKINSISLLYRPLLFKICCKLRVMCNRSKLNYWHLFLSKKPAEYMILLKCSKRFRMKMSSSTILFTSNKICVKNFYNFSDHP